jgi:Golgi SNAP receptor complex protein 1
VLTRTLLISQLEEINDHLEKLATTPDLMSPSMLRAIQRHRELYQDDMRELKRAKVPRVVYPNPFSTDGVIFTSRQTSNKRWIKRPCFQVYGMTLSKRVSLFPDLFLTHYSHSAYKSSAADSLLAERGRIDSSHRMTDDILQYVVVITFRLFRETIH